MVERRDVFTIVGWSRRIVVTRPSPKGGTILTSEVVVAPANRDEDLDELPRWVRWPARVIRPFLRQLARIGPIGRWLKQTIGARSQTLFRLRDGGHLEEAMQECLEILRVLESGSVYRFMWWFFVEAAADLADGSEAEGFRLEVERRVRDPILLPDGSDAAGAMATVSCWLWARGEREAAVALCQRARDTDPDSAWVAKVLDWYGRIGGAAFGG